MLREIAGRAHEQLHGKIALEQFVFYHTIDLPDGRKTSGWPPAVPITDMVRREMRILDWAGKRVIDVGCRDGLLSFEAERLGAGEVIGIDSTLTKPLTDFLVRELGSRVKFLHFNLFDLNPEQHGTFDIMIFSGVLYHLRYPVWALRRLGDMLRDGGTLVLETAILVDDNRHAMPVLSGGRGQPL